MEEESRRGAGPRRVAVVTGATGGVGRATARTLAAKGYDVALLGRGEAGLRGAADDVLARGGQALAIKVDVADWDQVRAGAEQTEDRLGPIDVWINNAMLTVFGPVSTLTADEIRRSTEATYLGQVHGALAALEHMSPRDRGTIVSVSSTLAYRSIPLQAAYCGGKAAARGFMESLRTELLHEGSAIRVTQVVLPAVNTPQFGWSRSRMPHQPRPVAPIYHPDVIARAIVRAAETAPRQRVIGTWNRMVLALNKLAPGVLDHFAALSSWEGQQVEGSPSSVRPGNLEEPLDDQPGADAGATGTFTDQAGGVLTPAFLRSLPHLAQTVGRGAVARAREIAGLR
ncbi:MAG: SDR family oxidoreductase [Ilumatobacteraceae bacterium]